MSRHLKITSAMLVTTAVLSLVHLCRCASFLKSLEDKVLQDLSRSPRHAFLDSILGKLQNETKTNLMFIGSSSSDSDEMIYNVSQPFRGIGSAEEGGGGFFEGERKKRHAITRALLAHPIVINVNGTNFTYFGSSLSASGSDEMFLYNQFNNHSKPNYHVPPYQTFPGFGNPMWRDKRDANSDVKQRMKRDEENDTPEGQVLLDHTQLGRKKRHTAYIPNGAELLGLSHPLPHWTDGNGTRILLGSLSASASMESGELIALVATPSSTTSTTTSTPTTSTPALTDRCCRADSCVTYQDIYDSCRASQVNHDTCMASLTKICTSFQQSTG